MNDKCEWKDGEFLGCNKKIRESFGQSGKILFYFSDRWVSSQNTSFCPWCGADIRKPEPAHPLIVKSGGTWVANWKGVDYLATYPMKLSNKNEAVFGFNGFIKYGNDSWQSFTGPDPDITELTDEIAKLRPIVKLDASVYTSKLIAVTRDTYPFKVIYPSGKLNAWASCRLATAKELEEAK
jgi:hypothetical protein